MIGISQSLITNHAICETVNQIEIIYQGNFPLAAITIHGAGNSSNHQVGLKLSNNNDEKKKKKKKNVQSISFIKLDFHFWRRGFLITKYDL